MPRLRPMLRCLTVLAVVLVLVTVVAADDFKLRLPVLRQNLARRVRDRSAPARFGGKADPGQDDGHFLSTGHVHVPADS